ncbi:MAG: OmpH family outer membrane protein, partial [Rikenellaceae bacterium]|nr:OmpH family outer membrane protein [Rikenellaceae bacterium]
MKNAIKLVLVALLALVGGTAMAQQVKLAYINSSELFEAMPEREAAFTGLQAFVKDFEDQLELIQVELNTKFQDYQKNSSTFTEAQRTLKEKELQDLSSRMQETQQFAEQEV